MSAEILSLMLSRAEDLNEHLSRVCEHIKLLTTSNAQLKELNANLASRLTAMEQLIKQLRAQQKEDPAQVLTEVHEFVQKLRDAQERKKRKNQRTVASTEGPSSSTAQSTTPPVE